MKKSILRTAAALTAGIMIACDYHVRKAAAGRSYDDIGKLPYNRVGIVLGTEKFLPSGKLNLYYAQRIEAAYQLLRAGKLEYLILSGDNTARKNFEPQCMLRDLRARGVEASRLFIDGGGYRTLDSMVRLKTVFGETRVTIISQAFHNERALLIAAHEGIDAIAFNAAGRADLWWGVREQFARLRVHWDFLTGRRPEAAEEQLLLPGSARDKKRRQII